MSTLENEFTAAMQWFNVIASARGHQKFSAIQECQKTSDEAWNLLLTYLNPFNVFHIRTKSLANDIQADGTPYTDSLTMLKDIMSMAAITNKKIAQIKATLETVQNEDVRQFIVSYLTKSAKIGVTADTVNKVVGSTVIPVFGCMLANKYFEHTDSVVGKMVAVTEKLDGIRALAIATPCPDGVHIEIYSRQGKRIYGLTEIESAIQNASIPEGGVVLDGELLITNRANIPSKEQYKQTTKIVGSDKLTNKTGITYNIFDVISKQNFRIGESEDKYSMRRSKLQLMFDAVDSPAIRIVPIQCTFSFSDNDRALRTITRLVGEARTRGEEGIMLNIIDAPYVCKRTNNLLKVKVFQDCDLKITGFMPGTGKFANTLGALLVDYKGNTVGVGSGLSDEQRAEFWNNQETYLGRVVTVQYFEETNDAEGNKSIRFPVFKELREEGKEISYN